MKGVYLPWTGMDAAQICPDCYNQNVVQIPLLSPALLAEQRPNQRQKTGCHQMHKCFSFSECVHLATDT